MASEIGFRPILRRHSSSSSSSSGRDGLPSKSHGMASKRKTRSPVDIHKHLPSVPNAIVPSIFTASQQPETRTVSLAHHPGTFLTLPANADSMQVQIRDTKISITRLPEQLTSLASGMRSPSLDYDNYTKPPNVTTATTIITSSADATSLASFCPAFPSQPRDDSSVKMFPVRGSRLIPSPNSAFTKTKSATALKTTDFPLPSDYANWTVPAQRGSRKPDATKLRVSSESGKKKEFEIASLTETNQKDSALEQNYSDDFAQILSEFWLRPPDIEIPVFDKPLSFKPLISCSLGNLTSDGINGATFEKTGRSDFQGNEDIHKASWSEKSKFNPKEAPTVSFQTTGSYPSSLRDANKFERLLAEIGGKLKLPEAKLPESLSESALQNTKGLINQFKSDDLEAISKSFTLQPTEEGSSAKQSHPAAQRTKDASSSVFRSTLEQPIATQKHSFWGTSPEPAAVSHIQPIAASKKDAVEPMVSEGQVSRPIAVSTTSYGKLSVSSYVLSPSLSYSSPSLQTLNAESEKAEEGASEQSIESAMHCLEKAISMLNSVAMGTNLPGVPMTLLSKIAIDTESLAKSFQVEATGSDSPTERVVDEVLNSTGNNSRHVVIDDLSERKLKKKDRSKRATSVQPLMPEVLDLGKNSIRQDAVLSVTLNLLDQTLAEIHQEFPPGKMPIAIKPRPKAATSNSRERHALPVAPEVTSFLEIPWNASCYSCKTDDSDQLLKRMLDRQDSFNRPGSALYVEPLPLPKDSVLQRYRRKKKGKSSASSSSSSTSSFSGEEDDNAAASAKRSSRLGHRLVRRQNAANRTEDGSIAHSKTKTRHERGQRRRREELSSSDREEVKQAYRQTDIQGSFVNHGLNGQDNYSTSLSFDGFNQPTALETSCSIPQVDNIPFEEIAESKRPFETFSEPTANISQSPPRSLTQSAAMSTISNISDSEKKGQIHSSVVCSSFRKPENDTEADQEAHGAISCISLQNISSSSSSSYAGIGSPKTFATRPRSSGSHSSAAETSTHAKNLTPFSPRLRRGNKSSLTGDEKTNDHQRSSSSAAASADEVFLASEPRPEKFHLTADKTSTNDDVSGEVTSMKTPYRTSPIGKERITSGGAHGCDYRAELVSADALQLMQRRGRDDLEDYRSATGRSFQGSARLTLKPRQQSEELASYNPVPDNSHKITHLSAQRTANGDTTDGNQRPIRAESKAVSYESICLKVKEENIEVLPKTIHIISLNQTPLRVLQVKQTFPEEGISEKQKHRSSARSTGRSSDVQSPSLTSSIIGHHQKQRRAISVETPERVTEITRPNDKDENMKLISEENQTTGMKRSFIHLGKANEHTKELRQPEIVFELNISKASGVARKIKELENSFPAPSQITSAGNLSVHQRENNSKTTILENSTPGNTKSVLTESKKVKLKQVKQRSLDLITKTNQNQFTNESSQKSFLKKERKPENDPFILGTVFTDRSKTRRDVSLPGTEFILRENLEREARGEPTTRAIKIVQRKARPTEEDSKHGQFLGNENDVFTMQMKLPNDENAAKTALESATANKDNGNETGIDVVLNASNDATSQVLRSSIKTSQPSSTSTSATNLRQKPVNASSVSRVSWAKQRFGDGPTNAESRENRLSFNNRHNATILQLASVPGHHKVKCGDSKYSAMRRQDGDSSVDRSTHPSVTGVTGAVITLTPLGQETSTISSFLPSTALPSTLTKPTLSSRANDSITTKSTNTATATTGMLKTHSTMSILTTLAESEAASKAPPIASSLSPSTAGSTAYLVLQSKDSAISEKQHPTALAPEILHLQTPTSNGGAACSTLVQKHEGHITRLSTTASQNNGDADAETITSSSVSRPDFTVSQSVAQAVRLTPVIVVESVIPEDSPVVVYSVSTKKKQNHECDTDDSRTQRSDPVRSDDDPNQAFPKIQTACNMEIIRSQGLIASSKEETVKHVKTPVDLSTEENFSCQEDLDYAVLIKCNLVNDDILKPINEINKNQGTAQSVEHQLFSDDIARGMSISADSLNSSSTLISTMEKSSTSQHAESASIENCETVSPISKVSDYFEPSAYKLSGDSFLNRSANVDSSQTLTTESATDPALVELEMRQKGFEELSLSLNEGVERFKRENRDKVSLTEDAQGTCNDGATTAWERFDTGPSSVEGSDDCANTTQQHSATQDTNPQVSSHGPQDASTADRSSLQTNELAIGSSQKVLENPENEVTSDFLTEPGDADSHEWASNEPMSAEDDACRNTAMHILDDTSYGGTDDALPDTLALADSKEARKADVDNNSATQTSPSVVKTNLVKPCIVRKQLIHLDSALHPSSCVPSDSKEIKSRWSPKLVRKLNLGEAQGVDMSDLNVHPELMNFLSKKIEQAEKSKLPERDYSFEDLETLEEITRSSFSAPQKKPPVTQMSKATERDDIPSVTGADEVRPDTEAGKRKFLSALKADAASIRAKLAGVDDRSLGRNALDRLASFAIISDVGIGAKRRQFKELKKGASHDGEPMARDISGSYRSGEKLSPFLEYHSSQTENKTSQDSSKQSSVASSLESTKSREEAMETKMRSNADEETKTRLIRPELDSDDDDFDHLVEINFRQLVDGKGTATPKLSPLPDSAAGKSARTYDKTVTETSGFRNDRRNRRESKQKPQASGEAKEKSLSVAQDSDEKESSCQLDKAKISSRKEALGAQSRLKAHGSRHQISRFQTQPVTFEEIEKVMTNVKN